MDRLRLIARQFRIGHRWSRHHLTRAIYVILMHALLFFLMILHRKCEVQQNDRSAPASASSTAQPGLANTRAFSNSRDQTPDSACVHFWVKNCARAMRKKWNACARTGNATEVSSDHLNGQSLRLPDLRTVLGPPGVVRPAEAVALRADQRGAGRSEVREQKRRENPRVHRHGDWRQLRWGPSAWRGGVSKAPLCYKTQNHF